MAQVFDEILLKGIRSGQLPARNAAARKWFRDLSKDVGKSRVTPNKMLADSTKLVSSIEIGKMYHFRYDPKGKQTLPYYDKFPLIFVVDNAPGGFYGLNLHYLPIKLRAKLMDALYSIKTNRRYDDSTRIAFTYSVLKHASRYKYFKPTFKHYLASHVQSQYIMIHPTEWDIALMLPTQRFAKASADQVWADSRAKI
jgi:hypothetical protein